MQASRVHVLYKILHKCRKYLKPLAAKIGTMTYLNTHSQFSSNKIERISTHPLDGQKQVRNRYGEHPVLHIHTVVLVLLVYLFTYYAVRRSWLGL